MTERIGYSTNVHPGRTLDEALAQLDLHAPRVRDRLVSAGVLDPSAPLLLGLWLSAEAARSLRTGAESGSIDRLSDWFASRQLLVHALNGFPSGHFHYVKVKHAVYRPSWAAVERLLYTQDLAEILAELAARAGRCAAGISTVPIGWRREIETSANGAALGVAAAHLEQMVRFLSQLEERTGVHIHLDLEPEPGCFLDRARDVVNLFDHALRPRATDPDPRRYLGVCHDVCHAAVMWESQAEVIECYRSAGIQVGRIQLSSALEATLPHDLDALGNFAEPRYLHQTTLRAADGTIQFFEDLPEALESFRTERSAGTARTHLHVPLASDRAGALGTTRREVESLLHAWPRDTPLPALEVETYTWSVLPGAMQPPSLDAGIASEIAWAQRAVIDRHAQPMATDA